MKLAVLFLSSIGLALTACNAPRWSVSVLNATGQPLPKVSCTLASTTAAGGGAAGSATIDDGQSVSFTLEGEGPPKITLAIVWSPGEQPQQVELDRPSSANHAISVRLAPNRQVEVTPKN